MVNPQFNKHHGNALLIALEASFKKLRYLNASQFIYNPKKASWWGDRYPNLVNFKKFAWV